MYVDEEEDEVVATTKRVATGEPIRIVKNEVDRMLRAGIITPIESS